MFFLNIILATTLSFAGTQKECHSAKEYITTYNFLKSKKELLLKEEDLQLISTNVTLGCDDAAKRFIKVFEILSKAEVDSKSALNYAKIYSKRTNNAADAFVTVFKDSFLKDFLDLDLKTSLDLANKIVPVEDKLTKIVSDDFENITKFCKGSSGLTLNGQACANLAIDIVNSSIKYEAKIFKNFKSSFDYLSDGAKVNLASFEALKLAKEISSYGPKAFDNFKETYEFLMRDEVLKTQTKTVLERAIAVSKNSSFEKKD